MINFSLNFPPKIDFGWGAATYLPKHVNNFGKRALLFVGSHSLAESGTENNIFDALKSEDIDFEREEITSEPSVELIDALAGKYRGSDFDVFVGIGGGSVLDATKAVAAMCAQDDDTANYLDYGQASGPGKMLKPAQVPIIAMPSNVCTGSEATNTAALVHRGEAGYKGYLKEYSLMPKVALIDPSLTITLTQEDFLFNIIDSFSSMLEAFVSKGSNIFTDSLMLEGLSMLQTILMGMLSGTEMKKETFEQLAYASLMAGIASSNSATTIHQNLAFAISGIYDIPHAKLMATLLYPATLVNMRKVQMFDAQGEATAKYSMFGSAMSGMDYAFEKHHVLLRAASETLLSMRDDHQIPSLEALGVQKADFYKIASATRQEGNPIELAETEIMDILDLAW
ncbi:MAG: iron-containing alcohol dehydrogenase [Eubacteriaceae bacterium]|nr:iron-containing alcohol dehydrogenase [Eubacteriaceae bacterium]